MTQKTEWRCLIWYDGPHIEIRGERQNSLDINEIVEVRQWLNEPETPEPQKGSMRLTRQDLQTMLDLLDGKPVADEPTGDPSPVEWKEADG